MKLKTLINKVIKNLIFSFITFMGTSSAKIVMWDMGHVLVKPNKLHMVFSHLGMDALGQSEEEIRAIVYDIQHTARFLEERNSMVVDDKSKPLCNLHSDYLAGICSSQEAWDEIEAAITLLEEVGYFKSKRQKRLAYKILQIIYHPETCSKFMVPITAGTQLLKKCAAKRDENGNLCHEMMILSNWDKESFPLMQADARHDKIFKHFKPANIIISGSFGHRYGNKPYTWLYNYVISYKQAKPSDFVFIDDQLANIEAARACGMHAIHLKDGNYKAVEKELKALGVL